MTVNFSAGSDRFKAVVYLTDNKKVLVLYELYIYKPKIFWQKMSSIPDSIKKRCEEEIKRRFR